jgi:hypothetical protein
MADSRISALAAASTLTGDELVEVSQLSTTIRISAGTISALASDNSYNDSGNGFLTAGFGAGDRVRVSGFTGNTANNILVGIITAITAGKMTIGGTDGDVIVDDAAGETVVISKWVSRRSSFLVSVRRLFSAFTAVGIAANTTEQDLQTYSLPAGTLASDGQAVRIRVRGQYALTSRSRQLRLYFGSTVVCFGSSTTNSAFNIDFDVIVMRSGAATQKGTGNVIMAVNNTTTAAFVFQSQTAPAETLSGAVTIKVTGQSGVGAVANDVVCDLFTVEVLP